VEAVDFTAGRSFGEAHQARPFASELGIFLFRDLALSGLGHTLPRLSGLWHQD